jgi:hypothetical protein
MMTDLSQILVQLVPSRVMPHERQIVLQAAMEANVATSSESPHTPLMAVTKGGIPPPNPPSSVRTTVVLTSSTLGSGLISSSAMTTSLFTQSVAEPPFSYGILGFDTNFILTYSTLQTMGLGEGSSNSPLQGSIGCTSSSYNTIHYGGSHIPPLSPSLSNAFHPPIRLNMNYNLFGAGILGPSSYTILVGSMSFSLFDIFGNNAFSSAFVSAGGNLGFGQQNHVQGIIPTQEESTRILSSQGLCNP